MSATTPFTLLIAALGGEGGGVMADWIIAAAMAEGYPVQSTSIPGVAQRTGATTYYIELYPARAALLAGRRPVMTLAPAPADIAGWIGDAKMAGVLVPVDAPGHVPIVPGSVMRNRRVAPSSLPSTGRKSKRASSPRT